MENNFKKLRKNTEKRFAELESMMEKKYKDEVNFFKLILSYIALIQID